MLESKTHDHEQAEKKKRDYTRGTPAKRDSGKRERERVCVCVAQGIHAERQRKKQPERQYTHAHTHFLPRFA